MGNPLSNGVPSAGQNAYEPDEPTRDSMAGDPPVMREPDGSGARAATAKHAQTKQARNSRIASRASRPAPRTG